MVDQSELVDLQKLCICKIEQSVRLIVWLVYDSQR
jgi:hypothetical protein